jgi:Protein of unknown function (DUF2950)
MQRHSIFAGIAATILSLSHAASAQQSFATPEQAADALIAANRSDNTAQLQQILGPDGESLINSGDPVADTAARARFVAAYQTAHRLERDGADRVVLVVGERNWPLPLPMVRQGSAWHFDTEAGRQQILDRRIGRNELDVIAVCRAYVEAQREFARGRRLAGGQAEYAQHFRSTPGKHDGLYWPVGAGEPPSPLGPLVAEARAEGYAPHAPDAAPRPYHGYYYRIITRQGPHAPGGARNYVVGGRMTGGFALLAFPARYGDSGIMTFIVNEAGVVFEKNLGPATASLAENINEYDPDDGWTAP